MANPWFRLYAEFAFDPKIQRMPEALQRRFVMLLCLRCSNGDVTLHDDDVTFQLRISNAEWAETKAVFVAKNLIDESNNVIAWEKRQFVSDSSAERVRRHREKMKQACNVTVTPPDTDTDTEHKHQKEKINKKEKPAAPRRDVEIPEGVSKSTWADWLQLRKAKRAPVTQTAIDQIEREAVKAGWTLEQALAESTARGWTGFKADWLQQHAAIAAPRKTQHQINAEATARALGYGQSNGSFFDVIGECHEVKADVAARLGGSDFQ